MKYLDSSSLYGAQLARPGPSLQNSRFLDDVHGWPPVATPCTLTARWTSALTRPPKAAWEASPSLVYGAALLMRLGAQPPPGFESRSLRPLASGAEPGARKRIHRKLFPLQLDRRRFSPQVCSPLELGRGGRSGSGDSNGCHGSYMRSSDGVVRA